MADLRADLAALLAKVERMTPGEWIRGSFSGRCISPGHRVPHPGPNGKDPCIYEYRLEPCNHGAVVALPDVTVIDGSDDGLILADADAAGIVALRNAAPRYLAALARIAEIVAAHDSRVDYAGDALDEIRAILDGARGGGG